MDANICMREANFLLRTLTSSLKAKNVHILDDEVTHALSLIWKYVIVIVDQCLFTQETKFKRLEQKFDASVEQLVKEKAERFERDRFTFDQQRAQFEKKIQELEKKLITKDEDRQRLKAVIKEHEL